MLEEVECDDYEEESFYTCVERPCYQWLEQLTCRVSMNTSLYLLTYLLNTGFCVLHPVLDTLILNDINCL